MHEVKKVVDPVRQDMEEIAELYWDKRKVWFYMSEHDIVAEWIQVAYDDYDSAKYLSKKTGFEYYQLFFWKTDSIPVAAASRTYD